MVVSIFHSPFLVIEDAVGPCYDGLNELAPSQETLLVPQKVSIYLPLLKLNLRVEVNQVHPDFAVCRFVAATDWADPISEQGVLEEAFRALGFIKLST